MNREQVQGAVRQMEGSASGLAGDHRMHARGKLDGAGDSMQGSYRVAMQDLQDFADRLRLRTREQPLVALLTAAAIGYLIGRVGRWL